MVLMFCRSPPSGGVFRTGGGTPLLSARRRHLPATRRRLHDADGQQLATHHGPQTEGRFPQEPGGVCGQRGRPSVRQITTGLLVPETMKSSQSQTPSSPTLPGSLWFIPKNYG